jgi:lipoate-protein ligase A
MDTLRWISDAPLDGPANMARDEALLTRVGLGQSPPTLRFYSWNPATISLGYFQSYADYEALPLPAGRLAVVRRQTGGGAILHDLELTYSLVLPLGHPLLQGPQRPLADLGTRRAANTGRSQAGNTERAQAGCPISSEVGDTNANAGDVPEVSGCGDTPSGILPNATGLYRHVHAAAAGLLGRLGLPITFGPDDPGHSAQRGPFFCFERHAAFDLLAAGRKIMGSAQRRTRAAVLQHGSLILDRRYGQQPCATLRDYTDAPFEPCLPELAAAIAGPCTLSLGSWTEEELALAEESRAKYAGAEWTRQR